MTAQRPLSRLLLAFATLLAAFGFALAAGTWPAEATARSAQRATGLPEVVLAELPPEARTTLDLIKKGGPFPYRRDGTMFGNREHRLPQRPRGYYSEYTVPTPGARNRGARRIIAGRGPHGDPATSGEYYYTGDHYETFQRIRE